jgi:hypothetical protein
LVSIPLSLEATEPSFHYIDGKLHCHAYSGWQNRKSYIQPQNEVFKSDGGKLEKENIFGLTLYTEKGQRAVSTNPKDQFDPRQGQLDQISADRVRFSENSRVYFSSDDGFGYNINKRVDISTKGAGIKFQIRF